MTTAEMPSGMSDDERAEYELQMSALRAGWKYAAPGLWMIPVGIALAVVTWPLAVVGALHLGWWPALVFGVYFAGRLLYMLNRLRVQQRVELQRETGEQVASIRERHRVLRSRSRSSLSELTRRTLWVGWLLDSVPKSVLVVVALGLWWPVWAAVVAGVASAGWPLVSPVLSASSKRLKAVNDMLIRERGVLPTPEI